MYFKDFEYLAIYKAYIYLYNRSTVEKNRIEGERSRFNLMVLFLAFFAVKTTKTKLF